MLIGFPEWLIYVPMVPPLALTAVIALVRRGAASRAPIEERPERRMTPLAMTGLIFGLMLALMALRTPISVAHVRRRLGRLRLAGRLGAVLQLPQHPGLRPLRELRPLGHSAVHPDGQLRHPGRHLQGPVRVRQRRHGTLPRRPGDGRGARLGAFGAICGSSVATAATITSVALPEMRRHGYSGRLATGTLAAGGTLGILIPPSVPLVIYAILAEQNIAKLFAAAMVPGIIAMVGYMVAIAIYVRLVPGQAPEHDDARPRAHDAAMLGVVLPIAIIFLSSSAASTAACSRPPKAPRSAPPRPSSRRCSSAR